MKKHSLTLNFCCLFLSFGLISCSADSPTGGVDSFQLPYPQVQRMEQGKQKLFSVKKETPEALLTSDEIKLANMENKEIKLRVVAICSLADSLLAKHTTKFEYKEPFFVRSLLPDEINYQPRQAWDKVVRCQFKIYAKNSLGSTDQHLIDHRLIVEDVDKPELNVRINASGIEPTGNTLITLDDYSDIYVANQTEKSFSKYRLRCENFWIDTSNLNSFGIALNDFNFSNVKTKYPLPPKDAFGLKPKQTCRMFTLETERVIGASNYFDLALPGPQVKVEVNRSIDGKNQWRGPIARDNQYVTALQITLTNQEDYSVYFKIPQSVNSKGIQFEPVLVRKYLSGHVKNLNAFKALHFKIHGPSKAHGHFQTFEVPARKSRVISAQMQMTGYCYKGQGHRNIKRYRVAAGFFENPAIEALYQVAGPHSQEILAKQILVPRGAHGLGRKRFLDNAKAIIDHKMRCR